MHGFLLRRTVCGVCYSATSCIVGICTDLSSSASGNPPPARSSHGVTSVQGKVYVYGGWGGSDYLDDFHVYDPNASSWTDLINASYGANPPPARAGHGFTFSGSQLYVHGGWNGNIVLEDFFVFDIAVSRWTDISTTTTGFSPSPRAWHGFASAGGKLYVQGGLGLNGYLNDLHVYDPAVMSWKNLSTPVSGNPPFPRRFHGFTALGNLLYVHGGCSDIICNSYLSDLHIYNVTSMIWNDISSAVAGDSPSPRNGHRITPMEGKLYVQGGVDTTGYLNDLHVFDPSTMLWTNLAHSIDGVNPLPRRIHGFTSAGGRLYVHGGASARQGYLNDLLVYTLVGN